MTDFLLDSDTDSGHNPVELHPMEGYRDSEGGLRFPHPGIEGNQQITYWPTRRSWVVPITWVNSSDASRIQNWWENLDALRWTLSESFAPSTYLVNIVNQSKPLNLYHSVNPGFSQGVLMLETVDNRDAATGQLFTLDDDVYGLLDQDYNPLG